MFSKGFSIFYSGPQKIRLARQESLHNLMCLLTYNYYLIHSLLRVFAVCCLNRYLIQVVKKLSNAAWVCRLTKCSWFNDLKIPYDEPAMWLSWMRRLTGDQEVAGSTPAEVGNILSWRLIVKYFLRSFSPFR